MARQNPISEVDQQIGQRLRNFRIEKTGLSAVEFARRMGIDSNRLASYEHGRSPLPYEIANCAAFTFNICQRWLAEGIEPVRFYVSIGRQLRERFPKRAVFSDIYKGFLKPYIDDFFQQLAKSWGGNISDESLSMEQTFGNTSVGDADGLFLLSCLHSYFVKMVSTIPPDLYQAFYRDTMAACQEFYRVNSKRIETWESLQKKEATPSWIIQTQKTHLTDTSGSASNAGMKAQWPELKKQLRQATAQIGAKSTLAKFLKVDPTQISQWLSDSKSAREPGAEYALQMQAWLNDPNRPTK